MNVQKLRTSFWNSFLSLLVLGVFVLLASGSLLDVFDTIFYHEKTTFHTIYKGDHVYEETVMWGDEGPGVSGDMEIRTGKKNESGEWDGTFKHTHERYGKIIYTEEVVMVRGKRHGKAKITDKDGNVRYNCFSMGNLVDCQESNKKSLSAFSSFQILNDKYPWVVNSLNFLGYEDAYVEAFMDALESILDTCEFTPASFDQYYQFGIEELEDTPYDSIIVSNMILSYIEGRELLKNNELRLAIIDRYRSDGLATKDMVNSRYSHLIDSWYFDHQEFADFCDDLDSCMNSYGPLDLEDPFFIDSVDMRFARSLLGIVEYKEDATVARKSAKGSTLRELKHRIQDALIAPTTQSVAIQVMYFLEREIDQGDILKRAVLEAYSKKRGWLQTPTVTTELSNRNSATSVTLQGLVLEDGGAEVTSRGIALATYYNPTIYDQIESSGTGTGEFTIEVNGLTEGAYYARTYATNSAGTAYGNCISFSGSGATGLEEIRASETDLKIYPNPTSGMASLRFQMESSKSMVLNIIDLKGQVVDHRDLGILPLGENTVQLDLSSLHGGIYHLQLSNQETIIATRKLLIVH